MTTRTTLEAALNIYRAGSLARARANNFGITKAEYAQHQKQWNWAMRVLHRKPCGARRRRDGKPCRALREPGRKRCKWHGGLSTGPKSPEGKARALANLRQNQNKQ